MKIAVCVKIVDGELNPFDECALEAALCVENGSVSVVSMCPPSAAEKLRSLTRLGVKEVFLLSDRAFAGSDTLATAYILSCQLKKMNPDLIFCGRQTIDGDTAQVGPCLATLMGIGLITNVMSIDKVSDEIRCTTRMGEESAKLPALVTVERINTLRFPSIRSKLGGIEVLDNSAVGADVKRCGLSGSPTKVIKTFENNSGTRKCKFIEPTEFLNLYKTLVTKERSGVKTAPSEKKMKSVWAIGDTVSEKARLISDDVCVIYEKDPVKIAELAKRKKPSAILWNADLWGRKTAPQVAAMLSTGLCADCTALETDGEKLFMYRPAKGGNIVAKIECRTLPQTATVRCSQKSDDVIVSGGRGVMDNLPKLIEFAKSLGASYAVSRPLVDKNLAPYDRQVGLTGKNAAPKIYIAVGISGAVQHVCAIEGADTVIAVNPDKNAPIFRYADYGIVCRFDEFVCTI